MVKIGRSFPFCVCHTKVVFTISICELFYVFFYITAQLHTAHRLQSKPEKTKENYIIHVQCWQQQSHRCRKVAPLSVEKFYSLLLGALSMSRIQPRQNPGVIHLLSRKVLLVRKVDPRGKLGSFFSSEIFPQRCKNLKVLLCFYCFCFIFSLQNFQQ